MGSVEFLLLGLLKSKLLYHYWQHHGCWRSALLATLHQNLWHPLLSLTRGVMQVLKTKVNILEIWNQFLKFQHAVAYRRDYESIIDYIICFRLDCH